jgi:hypothetical protein
MDGCDGNIENWWGGWRQVELGIREIEDGMGDGLLKMRGKG